MKLQGRIALVTGASRGIGAKIAVRLAHQGMNVAITGRDPEGLRRTAGRIYCASQDALVIPADVTAPGDRDLIVKRVREELGPIAVLVNNAGVEAIGPFDAMDPADIDRILTTNLAAPQHLTHLIVPEMLHAGGGHVVNIASIAAKGPSPFAASYAASKAGLVAFSTSLREELRGSGVGVSVVCPGVVSDTGLYTTWPTDEKPPLIGFVTSHAVATGVLKAIKRNRAEVIVAPHFRKLPGLLNAISPDLIGRVGRRAGLFSFMEELSDRLSRRKEGSS